MRTFYNYSIYPEIFSYNATYLKLPMNLAEKSIFSYLVKLRTQQSLFWNQECTIWAWKKWGGAKNRLEGFHLIHKMKLYYFISLTKIAEGFFVLDKQCIFFLTYIKFLLNITQAYNSNREFISALSTLNDCISALYRL